MKEGQDTLAEGVQLSLASSTVLARVGGAGIRLVAVLDASLNQRHNEQATHARDGRVDLGIVRGGLGCEQPLELLRRLEQLVINHGLYARARRVVGPKELAALFREDVGTVAICSTSFKSKLRCTGYSYS